MTWPDLIKLLLFDNTMDAYRYWFTLAAILVTALLIGLQFAVVKPAFMLWLERRYRRRAPTARRKPKPPDKE